MDDFSVETEWIFYRNTSMKKVLVELSCESNIFVSEEKEGKKRKKKKIEMMFMIGETRWEVSVGSIAV